ncbi:hypothetical protein LB507_009087, partial [Fusarium sp. FIESC RH6]
REAVNHFLDLRCIVFYSHPSQSPVKHRVEVKDRESIHPLLRQLSTDAAKLNPSRWLDKESELIKSKPHSERSQAQKEKKKRGKKKRLGKYTYLDPNEYTTLEKGQRDKADEELITYLLRHLCVKEYESDMLILDEAQCLRRTSGSCSNLLRLLNWKRLLFVTGTPVAGSLRDLLSPLTLIAHTNLGNEALSTLHSVVGYISGLCLDDHNPFEDTFQVMDGELALGETRGIFPTTFWEELENEGATRKDLLQALKD